MTVVPACRWRRGRDRAALCISPKIVSNEPFNSLEVCPQCPYADHEPVKPEERRTDLRWLPKAATQGAGLKAVHIGPSLMRAGAEFWLKGLLRFLDPAKLRVESCLVTDGGLFDPTMAAGLGIPAKVATRPAEVREAVESADVLLTWGHCHLGAALGPVRPKLSVFVAHGEGDWTHKGLAETDGKVDHVIAVSQRVADSLKAITGLPVSVIPNGIDLARIAPTRGRTANRARFRFTEDEFVIGYMGRYFEEKRPQVIIEALARLPGGYKALMVGWGGLEAKLRGMAERMAPGRVWFATAVNDVGDFYSAMDCFCLPSREEGFSLSLLEAMFSGLPVIATPAGSAAELIERGLLLGVDNDPLTLPDQIADAALKLSADPYLAWEMADNAKAWADEHGHARLMAERWGDLIQSLWRKKFPLKPAGPACVHWGEFTGKRAAGCRSCPIHVCAVHGEATISLVDPKVKDCEHCEDGVAREGAVPREAKVRLR